MPPDGPHAFLVGHATHPDWRGALALAAAQVDALAAQRPAGSPPLSLGLVYLTDHLAAEAGAVLETLRERWPGVTWVGATGVGIAATGAEYWDEPAIALMLCPLPSGSFEVFSGTRPLRWAGAHTALVHVDPSTADVPELLHDMSARVSTGYLFGGLVSSRGADVHIAEGTWQGGLSGVAFGAQVALVSRVTQGCQPAGPTRRVTRAEGHLVAELDGRPALQCLVEDLDINLGDPRQALPRLRATLAGLSEDEAGQLEEEGRREAGPGGASPARTGRRTPRGGAFGPDVRVRHLIGLDPAHEAVAVADRVEPGMALTFCTRDVDAARRDLVRICSEIRDEVESGEIGENGEAGETGEGGFAATAQPARHMLGAVYVSCTGRGGAHFGSPSAELRTVQRALGDVPLVGFFASGEIGRHHLYGYTGVLTVFTAPATPGRGTEGAAGGGGQN